MVYLAHHNRGGFDESTDVFSFPTKEERDAFAEGWNDAQAERSGCLPLTYEGIVFDGQVVHLSL